MSRAAGGGRRWALLVAAGSFWATHASAQPQALVVAREPEACDRTSAGCREPEAEPECGDCEEPERTGHPDLGVTMAGVFGFNRTRGTEDGWFGRLELGAFGASSRGAGSMIGVQAGAELWLADDAGGGGAPIGFYVAGRTPALFLSGGLGTDWIIIDRSHGDTGFGIFAPYADARLGFDLKDFRLLAQGRLRYRWQWFADDRTQLQIGLVLERVWPGSSSRRRPRRRPSR